MKQDSPLFKGVAAKPTRGYPARQMTSKWLIGVVLLTACSKEAGPPCYRGDSRECLGPERCEGVQFCLDDGSGWEDCSCGTDATSAPPTPPADGTSTDPAAMDTDTPAMSGTLPGSTSSSTGGPPGNTDETGTTDGPVVDGGETEPMAPDTGEPTDLPTDPAPTDEGTDDQTTDPVEPPTVTDPPPESEADAGAPGPTPPEDAPVVVFLLDQSSSMFSPAVSEFGSSEPFGSASDNWEGVRNALATLGTAIQGLEIGLMSFTGQIDGTCPFTQDILEPGVSSALSVTYTLPLGPMAAPPFAGQTPTGEALEDALAFTLSVDLPGKKHIIVMTDGDPDTCAHPDPQCGQDFTVAMAQQAYAAGVSVHAVGVTHAVQQPFLESLAYAGRGLPVPPPLSPEQQDCLMRQSGSLGIPYDPNNWREAALADYASDDTTFGEALAYVATNDDQLSAALIALLEYIRYDH